MKTLLLATTVIAAFIAPTSADAALFVFDVSGSRSASFNLDSMALPTFSSAIQSQFSSVSGIFNGISGVATINFQTTGFEIVSPSLGFSQFSSDRPLFTGTTSSPTFLTGTFQLSGIVSGRSVLNVSPLASAVPEPATWAMMLIGFGAVGYSLRKKRGYSLARAI